MVFENRVTKCPKCGNTYLYPVGENPSRDFCGDCNTKLIHTSITAEECYYIEEVSKDPSFFFSMAELKESNPIEYNVKLAQIKAPIQQRDEIRTQEKAKVRCPKCGSTNITAGQRGYSLLTGFLGSGSTVNRCANCGYKWKPGK